MRHLYLRIYLTLLGTIVGTIAIVVMLFMALGDRPDYVQLESMTAVAQRLTRDLPDGVGLKSALTALGADVKLETLDASAGIG